MAFFIYLQKAAPVSDYLRNFIDQHQGGGYHRAASRHFPRDFYDSMQGKESWTKSPFVFC
jgi:hypothetical protein